MEQFNKLDKSIESDQDDSKLKKYSSTSSLKHKKRTHKRSASSSSTTSSSSRSSSESISVSDLLSDSSASNSSNEDVDLSMTDQSSDQDSEDNTSKKNNDLEEGEINETSKSQEPQLSEHSPAQQLKEQILKMRKKCKECQLELKKISKHLKLIKKKLQQPDQCTAKQKQRLDVEKAKNSKRKKKLEKTFLNYKSKLTSLSARHSLLTKDSNSKHKHRHEKSKKSPHQSPAQPTSNTSIKLPYPVLNDKRDPKIILNILKDKQKNLNQMLDQTLKTLDNMSDTPSDSDDLISKRLKLKNLEDNIRVQLTRLNRQIDYINLSLEMQKLKKNQDQNEFDEQTKRRLNEMNSKIENLLTLMKDANRKVVTIQQTQEQETKLDQTQNKSASISTPPISYFRNVPPPIPANNTSPSVSYNMPTSAANASSSSSSQAYTSPTISAAPKITQQPSASFSKPPMPTNNYSQFNQKSKLQTPLNQTKQSNTNGIPTNKIPPSNHRFSPNYSSNAPNAASNQKQLTSSSDPKAIAAMLNEKYGYKSQQPRATRPNSPPLRNNRSVSPQYNAKAIKTPPLPTNQLSSNFNMQAMINSPQFMQTMTSMLSNMSSQGINVNSIINSMPSLIGNFDFNSVPNMLPPVDKKYQRGSQQQGSSQRRRQDDALLPNPPAGYGLLPNASTSSTSVSSSTSSTSSTASNLDPMFSKAFYNYLANFAQTFSMNNPSNSSQMTSHFNPDMFAQQFSSSFDNYNYNDDYYHSNSSASGSSGASNTRYNNNYSNEYDYDYDDSYSYYNNNNLNSNNNRYNNNNYNKNNIKRKKY